MPAMTFKRAMGIAKETSTFPPIGPTDPTHWSPSYDDGATDFFQEPTVIEPPQTRGTRGTYNLLEGAWKTTGRVGDMMLTPSLLALLLESILSNIRGTDYYRGDEIPPSYCFTYQRGGIWWHAIGMYTKTMRIAFSPEIAKASLDLSGYAVIQAQEKTPTFPAVIRAFPFWNLNVEIDDVAVPVKEITLNLEAGFPDANTVSGSKYTSTLVPSMLIVTVDFSIEKTQPRILELVQPVTKKLKLEAKTQDSANTFTIWLPKCYPTTRPDLRDDSNIIFYRVTYRAEVDPASTYEIRMALS